MSCPLVIAKIEANGELEIDIGIGLYDAFQDISACLCFMVDPRLRVIGDFSQQEQEMYGEFEPDEFTEVVSGAEDGTGVSAPNGAVHDGGDGNAEVEAGEELPGIVAPEIVACTEGEMEEPEACELVLGDIAVGIIQIRVDAGGIDIAEWEIGGGGVRISISSMMKRSSKGRRTSTWRWREPLAFSRVESVG